MTNTTTLNLREQSAWRAKKLRLYCGKWGFLRDKRRRNTNDLRSRGNNNMKKIVIYSTKVCPYCVSAKRLLESLNQKYEEVDLTNDQELRQKLSDENNGYRTVPMIFINDAFIGGFTELQKLAQQKQL